MATHRLRLGQLLVDAKLISAEDLDDALALQKADGRRLGTLLVERGLINETQLTQILSHQLAVPWVSLLHIEFSRQLLNLVPHDVAERFCLVPIYVRHVRNQGETLYVAMDDPTNDDGLKACADHSGLPVRAMIAPPQDIRSAIRVYYGATPRAPSVPAPALANAPAPAAPPPPPLAAPPAPSVEDPAPQPGTHERHASYVDVEIAEVSSETDLSEALAANEAAGEPEEAAEAPGLEANEGLQALAEAESEPEVAPPATTEDEAPKPLTGRESVSDFHVEHEEASEPEAPVAAVAPDAEPEAPPVAPPPPVVEVHAEEPAAPSFAAARSMRRKPRLIIGGEVPSKVAPPLEAASGLEGPSSAGPPSSGLVADIPKPRGRAPRMIALTLLDGTTISLPAKPTRRAEPDPIETEERPAGGDDATQALTARDLVAALRAVSHGADATEVLGKDHRWETMFAALLSLLLKKRLIADWEFVEELKKI